MGIVITTAVENPTAMCSCPFYPLGQLLDLEAFWYTD